MWSPRGAVYCLNCGEPLSQTTTPARTKEEQGDSAKSLFEEGLIDSKQYIALTKDSRDPKQTSRRMTIHENTEHFFDSLQLPTWEEMREGQKCAIMQRHVVIMGSPESGKSAKVDTLLYHPQHGIVTRYGHGNVGIQRVPGERFHEVLDAEKWPHKRIQVVVLEDCTSKTFQDKSMAGFWEIRHKMQEKTGYSHGLIVTIITAHSFYKIPDEFRTIQLAALLFSDIPTSPDGTFHHTIFEKFIPNAADREFLRKNMELRLRDRKRRGFAYWLRWGNPAGIIWLPEVREQKARWHPTLPVSEGKRELFVSLSCLLFLALTVYSYAVQNNTSGTLFWGFFLAVLALSWFVTRHRSR